MLCVDRGYVANLIALVSGGSCPI